MLPTFYPKPCDASSVLQTRERPRDELIDPSSLASIERPHASFGVGRARRTFHAEALLRDESVPPEHRGPQAHYRAALSRSVEHLRELVQFDAQGRNWRAYRPRGE